MFALSNNTTVSFLLFSFRQVKLPTPTSDFRKVSSVVFEPPPLPLPSGLNVCVPQNSYIEASSPM